MTWVKYFMSIALTVSKKSKDQSTQVGAIIVGPGNEIISTGFNGMPRGVNDDVPERHERPEKYFWMEHAERNAIYSAAKIGVPTKGCRMYCTHPPCMDCGRGIIQSGIINHYFPDPSNMDPELYDRWAKDFERIELLFRGIINFHYV